MKSCLDCKHGEETMFDEARKCINEKSVYYGKFVDDRDLCRECEEDES